MADKVRIGIVGAGGWTVNRMLPGFQKAAEVTAVANRNRANAERVADQFGIENVLDDWSQVIAHPVVVQVAGVGGGIETDLASFQPETAVHGVQHVAESESHRGLRRIEVQRGLLRLSPRERGSQ